VYHSARTKAAIGPASVVRLRRSRRTMCQCAIWLQFGPNSLIRAALVRSHAFVLQHVTYSGVPYFEAVQGLPVYQACDEMKKAKVCSFDRKTRFALRRIANRCLLDVYAGGPSFLSSDIKHVAYLHSVPKLQFAQRAGLYRVPLLIQAWIHTVVSSTQASFWCYLARAVSSATKAALLLPSSIPPNFGNMDSPMHVLQSSVV